MSDPRGKEKGLSTTERAQLLLWARLSIFKRMQGDFRDKLSAEKILSEMERGYSVLDNMDRRTCACACPALLKRLF